MIQATLFERAYLDDWPESRGQERHNSRPPWSYKRILLLQCLSSYIMSRPLFLRFEISIWNHQTYPVAASFELCRSFFNVLSLRGRPSPSLTPLSLSIHPLAACGCIADSAARYVSYSLDHRNLPFFSCICVYVQCFCPYKPSNLLGAYMSSESESAVTVALLCSYRVKVQIKDD